jgi:PPOX class probable F420-dependent enzyme
MELTTALAFVRERRTGVLTTIRRDGRPQLSNIVYVVDDTGTIRISVTADRAKTRNLARDPRAARRVSRDDFWAYVVIDATVELAPVAAAPDDPTVDELVELYRSLSGEHPDWSEYRAAMVRDGRLVVRLTPTGAYGMLPD